MKKAKKILALTLALSILFNGTAADAKQVKKTTVKAKIITMEIGMKKDIILKNKRKKTKYLYKSSKPAVAKVSSSGKVTARKAGRTKITIQEKRKKKTKKVGTVTVIVNAKQQIKPIQTPGSKPSQTPAATSQMPASTPDAEPTTKPTPKPTVTPSLPSDPRMKATPNKLTSKQSGVQYGTKIVTKYYSSTTDRERNVIVILPDGYTEQKKYPVLYLFHGGMGDENDWIAGNVQNMIGNMIAAKEAVEMILVLPNCRCREDDSAAHADGFALGHVQSFDNFINDFRDNLMPFINKTYSVADGRENTAIAGLSMGGRVSLNIGISLPDKVGYTGAFSPAYGIFPYSNNGLTEKGLFTEQTFTLPSEYKENTFLMINNGQQDTMVRNEPERYHNALAANGVEHIYYTIRGGHDWVVWRNGFYNFASYLFQTVDNGNNHMQLRHMNLSKYGVN